MTPNEAIGLMWWCLLLALVVGALVCVLRLALLTLLGDNEPRKDDIL